MTPNEIKSLGFEPKPNRERRYRIEGGEYTRAEIMELLGENE